jgi:hypothetical protein
MSAIPPKADMDRHGCDVRVMPLPLVGREFLLSLQGKRFALSDRKYFSPTINQYFNGNLLSVEGSMIDSVLNVAVFAALILCIVGFSAWAKSSIT